MTSADLRALAVFLKNRPAKAKIATWGADQVDMFANWQAVAQGQLDQFQAAVTDQQAQIADLQAQLAAPKIAPTTLVLLGPALHGFATSSGADEFMQANSSQAPIKIDTASWTYHTV